MKNILLIGASGGIGNKVGEKLLDSGYSVLGTYFQHPENVENLRKYNCFVDKFVDIRDIESLKNLEKTVAESFNNLYAIINCSGIVEYEGESNEKDFKIWKNTIDTNLAGNFYLIKVFQKHLVKDGRFIMISSTDSFFGGSITASYAASKAGVNSLTKSMSLLLSDKKIRVNAIAPGWVETPMIQRNGDMVIKKIADMNPLKRNALPVDIFNLIYFLLSEESGYLNGQVISLEGGYTNQDSTLLIEEKVQS